MKPALIAAAAAFCIAAATAFAMSTKAWADIPWWTSEDEMDEEVVFGGIDNGLRRRSAEPDQTMDYLREQYENSDSKYITPHHEPALRKGLPGKRP